MTATESEVRAASMKFYAALNSMAKGDAGAMTDIWSHSDAVTTMHPIGGRQVGWEQVKGPWAQVAQIATGGEVRLDDQIIQIAGEIAYELGVERGHIKLDGQEVAIDGRVTNIYRREAGGWKIVHHHTDISEAMMDILARLDARK